MAGNLDVLNSMFADCWSTYKAQVTNQIAAQAIDAAARFNPGLQIETVSCDFAAPMGVEALTDTNVTVALPLDPAATWTLRLHGAFTGDLRVAGQTISLTGKEITIHLDMRLVISALLDPNPVPPPQGTDSRIKPRLTSLSVTPQVHLTCGGFLSLDIPAGGWTVNPSDPAMPLLTTSLSVDLTYLTAGKVTDTATVDLSVVITPNLAIKLESIKIDGVTLGNLDITIKLGGVPSLFFQLLEEGNLPRTFGFATPIPGGDVTVPAGFDFAGAADTLDTYAMMHSPEEAGYFLAFDNQYTDPTDRTTLNLFLGQDDTAIWTGHYLAAQAFRCAAITSKGGSLAGTESLKQAGVALTGVEILCNLPAQASAGYPGRVAPPLQPLYPPNTAGLICRSALPATLHPQADPPFNAPNDATYSQPVTIGGKLWCGYGRGGTPPSRDAHIGVLFGLSTAWKLIEDAGIQARCLVLLKNLLAYLSANDWNVPTPTGSLPPHVDTTAESFSYTVATNLLLQYPDRLAFMAVGAVIDSGTYAAAYKALADGVAPYVWFSLWSDSLDTVYNYYKWNLNHATMTILLMFDTDAAHRQEYQAALSLMRSAIQNHGNAYFDLAYILGQDAAGQAQLILSMGPGIRNGLYAWNVRATSVAGPNGLPLQTNPNNSAYLKSALAANQIIEYQELGGKSGNIATFPIPVSVRAGNGLDFMWQRAPFLTSYDPTQLDPWGQSPDVESPGIDYLLPCWMARYLGIV